VRILGIDWGRKRIGVAVSDPLGITAQPLKIVDGGKPGYLEELLKLIKSYEVKEAVVGLPKNMDGTEGGMADEVKGFSEKLEEVTGVKVIFRDERLTSKEAERMLIETADIRRDKRKQIVDSAAACLILQSYLDSKWPRA